MPSYRLVCGVKLNNMEKILKSQRQVRFQDCDPFNHLNNAKYIDYFINAREDQIYEHYQLSAFEYFQNYGKSWLISSNQISYLKPASTMETVTIESQLIQFTNKTLLVEMKMWDKSETELKSVLWTRFVQFDARSNKVCNHSDDLMKLFNDIVVPVEETSFEERCTRIIQELKTIKY